MSFQVIDVSSWQGKPNWEAVKQSDVRGVIVKVSEDDVSSYPTGAEQVSGALGIGMQLGMYHFAHPELYSPGDSVWGFIKGVEDAGGFISGMIPFLDFEAGWGRLDRWCAEWGDLLFRERGVRAGFYSRLDFMLATRTAIQGVSDQYNSLWLADWDGEADTEAITVPGWPPAILKQYGIRQVSGINGWVDANTFFGTDDDWTRLGCT